MRHQSSGDPPARREAHPTPQGSLAGRTRHIPEPGQVSAGVHALGSPRCRPRGTSRGKRTLPTEVVGPRKSHSFARTRQNKSPIERFRTTTFAVLSPVHG